MRPSRRLATLLASSLAGVLTVAWMTVTPAHAASFGYTDVDGYITVDSGAGLVMRVRKSTGDMTSLRFNGTELQSRSRLSHIGSGLSDNATVTATLRGNAVVVTESAHDWHGTGTIEHYLVIRGGENTVAMATYVDAAGAGELRWVQMLDGSVLTDRYTPSDVRGAPSTVESTDIYLQGGQTRSKYYSNRWAMDLTVRGVTGSGVGVYMAYGNRESSSGGPFFRDIEQQGTGENELYNYLWSGHNDTEPQRLGVLNGPYALIVTGGKAPAEPDLRYMYDLGLRGAVPSAARGQVSGTASGTAAGVPTVVGFANTQAQYWTVPAADGAFTSPAMKPGTYTETLYQDELAVATRTVTVVAGSTTTGRDIAATRSGAPAIFRIGDWDGTPNGFKNAENVTSMHPSDARMAKWGPTTFTVGSSPDSEFPAYQWKDVNNPTTVRFTLPAGQTGARTVRIGITAAYDHGRPQIKVNKWTSDPPPASTQPDSRSLTIGTYRGNNAQFTYQVPAGVLVAGANTLTISVIGSAGFGSFLSAGVSFDCVELV